ncbi:unnamed protein product [Lactuca saligna]|uniref:Uncharacterized protein n=1 Tax=Lactuca saligna TaxID=75948 RepID=A0AA36ENL7_LACSI|nr:unnamed protein product [Lactuca saligna]
MLASWGNDSYILLDGDKCVVYILPNWVGDSFDPNDPDTWFPPDQLTLVGVLSNSEDEENDEEDYEKIPEAEDHFNQLPVQQPMYQHHHFQVPPHHFDHPQYQP